MNLYCYGNRKQCQLDKQEDGLYVGEIGDYYVFMVADGNGGTVGGICTGQLAINIMYNYLKKVIKPNTSIMDLQKSLDLGMYMVSQSFLSINSIDTKYENVYVSMSVLITSKDTLKTIYASTGNTEIQLIRNGKFSRINKVFSETYEALIKGDIEEADFYVHPGRARITSALGVFNDVQVEIMPIGVLQKDDIILMSTDGIYRYLNPDKVIQYLASAQKIEDGVNKVLDEVDEMGGEDNATLVVVHIYDPRG